MANCFEEIKLATKPVDSVVAFKELGAKKAYEELEAMSFDLKQKLEV